MSEPDARNAANATDFTQHAVLTSGRAPVVRLSLELCPMMVGMTDKAHWLAAARSAMQTEAEAVLAASERLGDSLLNAVDLIVGPAPEK